MNGKGEYVHKVCNHLTTHTMSNLRLWMWRQRSITRRAKGTQLTNTYSGIVPIRTTTLWMGMRIRWQHGQEGWQALAMWRQKNWTPQLFTKPFTTWRQQRHWQCKQKKIKKMEKYITVYIVQGQLTTYKLHAPYAAIIFFLNHMWLWRVGHMAQLYNRATIFSSWGGMAVGLAIVQHNNKMVSTMVSHCIGCIMQ